MLAHLPPSRLHLSGIAEPRAIAPYLQRPTYHWEPLGATQQAVPGGEKLIDTGAELDGAMCAPSGCAQARLCWANSLWRKADSRVVWFYGVVVAASPRQRGLSGASHSSLVRINKNPTFQRGGLLTVVHPSPFLSCCCPGSRKP